MSDSQSLNTHQENMQQYADNFIISFFKVLGYGFIVLIGLNILNLYFVIMNINLWWGSYIVFLPLIMVLILPLVLILLGVVNSYLVKYIYKRKTDETWLSLLLEGIFLCFIGSLFSVVWGILIIFFFGRPWPPPYYISSPFFILYSLLMLTSIGYASKEMTLVFFTTKKDSQKQPNFKE